MLALVGSGEYLPPMEPVDRVLLERLPFPPRVVCLPTAAGTEGPERIGYWSRLGVEHFTRLGARVEAVPIIDRASANDLSLADHIREANFVYLSGGKPGYLFSTLEDSLAWKAICAVLGAGGTLAGCSAGAMILGEKFYGFPGLKNGFGFLPKTIIMPHFDELSESMLQPIHLLAGGRLTLLGVDGNTALVQDGNRLPPEHQYEVLGSGGVTVWNKTGRSRYTQGPLPLWYNEDGSRRARP